MSEQFQVGDVVVVVTCKAYPQFSGAECQITEPLGPRVSFTYGRHYVGYKTDLKLPNGKWFCPEPWQIRKKQPPQQLVSWREIERLTRWNPTSVPA